MSLLQDMSAIWLSRASSVKREYKPDLLVASATIKGFEKPWSILIDSGASGNCVRRRSLEGSQQHAEALKVHEGDSVTVRLATSARVTVPKVPLNLGVTVFDFNSVERCLVLDLDSRYDLILGMAWLERHEPWIDWRSKTLGATRIVSSEALESHEPTFARKQKRYWREPLTESVSVLDIGVSELIDPSVNESSVERGSETHSETAYTPLSVGGCNSASLNAESIVGFEPGHQGLNPSDEREVARIYPPSDGGCNSASLSAESIVGLEPGHQGLDPSDERGVARICRPSDVIGFCIEQKVEESLNLDNVSDVGVSLDVSNDIGSGIEQVKVDEPINLGIGSAPTSSRGTVSYVRRQHRRMVAARRKASVLSHGDTIEHLSTE